MIVATVTVHSCDRCDALFAVKDQETRAEFLEKWFVGRRYEFCPDCRRNPETSHIRTSELRAMHEKVINGLTKIRREYVH